MNCDFYKIGENLHQCRYCGREVRSSRPRIIAECLHETKMPLGDMLAARLKWLGITPERWARFKARWLFRVVTVEKGCNCPERQQQLNEWGRWLEWVAGIVARELLNWDSGPAGNSASKVRSRATESPREPEKTS